MSTSRLQHPLPAPVVHAGFSIPQSKSHVLAGVQDAYWSDDEAEDAECPLCLEEMDISDLNFKPCICGYQICRFCWHHIKENLNKRCPACRRVYTDDAVEFKPIATQDHKRLTQQKKQRERERKDLDALGRRQLINVRIVQRNVVYIVGIGPRFAKEELIPTLRSHEYFGQYGKISKIFLFKRTPPGGSAPVVGLYITYHRREDAARAIAGVDGTPSPSGGREIMRASYGTTKYCMAFLRSASCNDHSCTNLHEWGDDKDCFTKEDLATLKHTIKATESRRNNATAGNKPEEQESGLPRTAAWGQKNASSSSLTAPPISTAVVGTTGVRPTPRRGGLPRQPRGITSASPSEMRTQPHRKPPPMKSPSQTSSRPATPANANSARLATSNDSRPPAQKPDITSPHLSDSPALSAAATSDQGSGVPSSPAARPSSTESIHSSLRSVPAVPPGLPAVPPGLTAPVHPPPSRPPRVESVSPQTPLLASNSSYQISNAARALLDDVKARRENPVTANLGVSPFPDFDRTLQTLSANDGGFSFNLDPKLAIEEEDIEAYTSLDTDANAPFSGSFVDAFPALRLAGSPSTSFTPPPGLNYPHNPSRSIYDPLSIRPSDRTTSNYVGSFNPFADTPDESSTPPPRTNSTPFDDDPSRKVSRFVFARGRQGSATIPSYQASPTLNGSSGDAQSLFGSLDTPSTSSGIPQWGAYDPEDPRTTSHSGSPHLPQSHNFVQHARPPADVTLSEAQLRDFIQSSKQRATSTPLSLGGPGALNVKHAGQPFHDPAIMSASFTTQSEQSSLNGFPYGPPPGLMNHGAQRPIPPTNGNTLPNETITSGVATTPTSNPPILSEADFPSLIDTTQRRDKGPDEPPKAQPKLKAMKKTPLTEKVERTKVIPDKTITKTAKPILKSQDKDSDAPVVPIEPDAPDGKEKVSPKQQSESQQPRADAAKAEPLVKGNKALKKETKAPTQTSSIKVPLRPVVPASAATLPELVEQEAILSRKPKKNKPVAKLVKVQHVREELLVQDDQHSVISTQNLEATLTPVPNTSRAPSQGRDARSPTSLAKLLEDLASAHPELNIPNHSIFDFHKINPAAKMPLEYGPLVHALSALSVGGGSFANHIPSGSIDNAVSSFQQLLETLTQTISDLLRLLPRTTWDDSSSFDGVLRDMLKGEDFLDDGGEEGQGKEDEVAALTQALERRARWMEVQLSKLEELHRDINTAAVRAVLAFNDNGWDKHHFLPRAGNTLGRFDQIGLTDENGNMRPMSIEELEKKLVVAKEAAVFAEMEMREVMERNQLEKPRVY
ncbi:hypothetical protein BDN72DRAFT_954290 [Pluteus cervinus]|uniref:Uncharacterized protein n=1 Tax=Pluteus cervinus TaxID=181527 RepID=A0ACD3BEP0_9AGAR|nr:hypothetical protein BDN72DRAFT_954290 [Pluteus cervinus]